jgi:acetolactate synthase-1/2/3 large subunit
MSKGSEIIAESLSKEDVKCVFTLPDGWLMPVYEELEKRGIRVISMRSEQAAANAADGWARSTRKMGVVAVAVGPGVANIMPSLAQAYLAGSPILALGGRTPFSSIDKMAFEEVNTHSWVEGYTKYSRMVTSTCRLNEYIQDAARQALTGRMGPTLLEIPKDISSSECDRVINYELPQRYRPAGRIYGDKEKINQSAELIRKSERPVIVAGSGAYWSGACEEIVKLAEEIHSPVATEGLAVGCIPNSNPLFGGNANAGIITRYADLVIVMGARFDEFLGYGRDESFFSTDTKVVHVDIDPTVIGKNKAVDIGIWGDVKAVTAQILESLSQLPKSTDKRVEWSSNTGLLIKAYYDRVEEEAASDEIPIRPQRLMRDLRDFAGENSIFILDGGDATAWAFLYLRSYRPGQIIWSHGPFGMIGTGIPMGIAAKLGNPDKDVYVITGDGSFLMSAVEIETASRYSVPITIVVVNDNVWGDVYHNRVLATGRQESGRYALLERRKYDEFARSLGGFGESVADPNQIINVLKRAKDSGLPSVVDVIVSKEFNSPLSQLQGFLKKD